MPFGYYGGKKALARHYPPPAHSTIIEPFAGSAAYALLWWRPGVQVVLVEKNPAVAATWHRLQRMTPADLAAIECPQLGEATDEPLIVQTAGGTSTGHYFGARRVVTPRMRDGWAAAQARMIAALPIIRDWTVIEGDYRDAPDLKATWFVDPPYAGSRGGFGYQCGSDGIDYDELGEWCRARRGQVIVCEQAGADWLPFVPFRRMRAGGNSGDQRRMEVVWHRSPASASPANRHARARAAEAVERRAARRGLRL